MKFRLSRIFILLLLVFLSALWIGTTDAEEAQQEEVVNVALGSWCPYACDPANEDGKLGYISEVVLTILRQQGVKTKTALMPYSRIIHELRIGRWHIAPGMAKPNAPDFIFSAEPVVYNSYHFYVRKGTPWRFEGPDSLDTVGTLGLVQGYSYDEIDSCMKEFLEKHHDRTDWLAGVDPLARNIKKLLAGRVDAMIADRWAAAYQLEKLGVAEQVVDAGQLGPYKRIYIGYSPAHPRSAEYARLIDKGIQELKASGAMLPLLKKYGLTEEVYEVPNQ